jgi:hypothetical protein
MSPSRPADPQAALVGVPRALIGSSVVVLAVAAFLNLLGRGGSGPEVLAWMATAWALAAVPLATLVRGQGLVAPPPPSHAEPSADLAFRLQKTIVFFGVLESAVVFAALAAMLSRPAWPLVAALFPLAVMALNLPSRRG